MTLLASERSLLIRNKFRSVLQLRIQNRRQQNEINADSGVKTPCHSQPGEKERSNAVCLADDSVTQKSPPSGSSTENPHGTAQDWCGGGVLRQKKARLAEDLSEKILRRPGPLELLHKHILPLDTASISFPQSSDGFEDDISCSSSSSSPEQLRIHQSPGFSMSPGLAGDQSLSDLSPSSAPLNHSPNSFQCNLALLPVTEGISQPMTMTVAESDSMATSGRTKGIYLTTQATPLLPKTVQQSTTPPPQSTLTSPVPSSRPPRSRKPRDSKPKMKKLKYHQYIPPDQRGGTGGGAGGGSIQRNSAPPIDPAYSRLLQQQQVFLQLQILNQQQQQQQHQQQQQQQLTIAPSSDHQILRFTGATQPACPPAVPLTTNPTPPDTSPSRKPELLPPNLDDLTVSELRQQLRKRGLPVSGTKPSLLERLRPYQLPRPCLAPAPLCQPGTNLGPSGPTLPLNPNPDASGSAPSLYIQPSNVLPSVTGGERPLASIGLLSGVPGTAAALQLPGSSPASSGAPWRSGQAADERSVEMEMRERLRSRPRDRAREVGKDRGGDSACENTLHPFLQQETGRLKVNSEVDGKTEVLFTQVCLCQPCDVIGQDFDLPMQITASPVQAPPSVRSLEEELQEAIQRVQMAPSQSIDDILDEPISCEDAASSVSDLQAAVAALSGSSPPPANDQSQPSIHIKEENFLSSPLCSSLLLELPPSPSNTPQIAPPPPPPPICTTPPPTTVSRKRREAATFDPADWLESLTSGLRPLTPPTAPFVETDFGLDSDLNVNRVLDLMVEQW